MESYEKFKENWENNSENNPLTINAKSSVKLSKNSRGVNWDIKVVSGEESLIEGLMLETIKIHKKLKGEFENE